MFSGPTYMNTFRRYLRFELVFWVTSLAYWILMNTCFKKNSTYGALIMNYYVNYPLQGNFNWHLSVAPQLTWLCILKAPHCEFCCWLPSCLWVSHSACFYLYPCPICEMEITLHTYQRGMLKSLIKMCQAPPTPDPLMKSSVIVQSNIVSRIITPGEKKKIGTSVEVSSAIHFVRVSSEVPLSRVCISLPNIAGLGRLV